MITGALVAIATPMRDDGSIDYDCYQKLIDWQVSEGADAIVSMGTSGESPTVSFEEHTAVVKAARPSVVRVLSRLGVSLQWATRPVRRRTRPASSSSSAEIRSKEELSNEQKR